MGKYFIKDGYVERPVPEYCDQRGNQDLCQWEVYEYAAQLPNVRSVLDVGCGGAYKLMTFFGDRRTLGLDVEPTVTWLNEHWVDREWRVSDFSRPIPGFDLLLCADVIEHLVDPDPLLTFIERCQPGVIVLSTPDRDRLQAMFHDGPPRNPGHVREWSAAEFRTYIGSRFDVTGHHLAQPGDFSTQFIVAKVRR